MSCLDGTEPLAVTVSYSVELSQVAIDRLDTMVGLASDLIGNLAFNITLSFALSYEGKPYETSSYAPFCILCMFDKTLELAKNNQVVDKPGVSYKFPRLTHCQKCES